MHHSCVDALFPALKKRNSECQPESGGWRGGTTQRGRKENTCGGHRWRIYVEVDYSCQPFVLGEILDGEGGGGRDAESTSPASLLHYRLFCYVPK